MHNIGAESEAVLEDYDSWEKEQKEEDGVVGLMETRAGRAARAKVVQACVVFPPSLCLIQMVLIKSTSDGADKTGPRRCKIYKVANFYPARAIAAACVRATNPGNSRLNARKWVEHVTGGKVDLDDCYDIIGEMEEYEGPADRCPQLDDVVRALTPRDVWMVGSMKLMTYMHSLENTHPAPTRFL